jgi:hypothetical protein
MMKLARRGIAITAAAVMMGTGAAVVAATAASATPAAPAAAKTCFGADLNVWVNADARSVIGDATRYHLEFTNAGKVACTLNGFPDVTAATAGLKQLGAPAAHSGGVPAATITLAPGATAHSVLGYVSGQVIPACKPARAFQLKVFAPGAKLAKHAFFPPTVCTTGRVDLYTWRVQAGY